jgi:hypothetical protein
MRDDTTLRGMRLVIAALCFLSLATGVISVSATISHRNQAHAASR